MSRITPTIERLHVSLDYHASRHALLTSNLANMETPGYSPVDLERLSPGEASKALATTDARHLGGSKGAGTASPFRVIDDVEKGRSLDGNSVDLDREAVKLAANNVRYDAVANLTSHELSTLVWAANDGRSV
ncbi:MAG: flagellar basal body rod protein FlgB [Polyangiaceae bacterium]